MTIDIKASSLAQLAEFYNKHAAKPITKFKDRATAERRVGELLAVKEEVKPSTKVGNKSRTSVGEAAIRAAAKAQPAAAPAEVKRAVPTMVSREEQEAEAAAQAEEAKRVAKGSKQPKAGSATKAKAPDAPKAKRVAKGSKPEGASPDVARSEAIAATWTDKDVAAKRAQRSAVEVDGVRYPSVRQAFIELKLPLKEHILHRMLLKEAKKLTDYGRSWKIIPLNY
jgi:colicin import membrane protein